MSTPTYRYELDGVGEDTVCENQILPWSNVAFTTITKNDATHVVIGTYNTKITITGEPAFAVCQCAFTMPFPYKYSGAYQLEKLRFFLAADAGVGDIEIYLNSSGLGDQCHTTITPTTDMTEYQIELPDYFMDKYHGWEGDMVQGYASIWLVFVPTDPNLNVYVDGLSIMQRIPGTSLAELSGWGEDTVTEDNGFWTSSTPLIFSVTEDDTSYVAEGTYDVKILAFNGGGACPIYITPDSMITTLVDIFQIRASVVTPDHGGSGAVIWIVLKDNTGSYCQQLIYESITVQEQVWQFWDRDGDFWWYYGPHFDPTNITSIEVTFYGLLNSDAYIDKMYFDHIFSVGASGKGKILFEGRDRR
jgi:hypothetical protein